MIYFIEAEGAGLIKIGYSRSDPDGRLSNMQTGSPCRLRRVALMEGTIEDELFLHDRFKDLWSHGEWFRDDPRVRAFIAENAVAWTGGEHVRFLSGTERAEIQSRRERREVEIQIRRVLTPAELAHEAELRAAVEIIRPSVPEPLRKTSWRSSDLMLARANKRPKV